MGLCSCGIEMYYDGGFDKRRPELIIYRCPRCRETKTEVKKI